MAAMISVSSTLIMIGFIFLAQPNLEPMWKIFVMALISLGMLSMLISLSFIQHEERKQRIQDQALLLNLMAIGIKMGVSMNELKQAREMLDMIDKVDKK
ncbi:MAG: hypothetical protein PHR43_07275 [Dehalococcoidales bacterium]|nr:hypothetical protein [Dehalococcoidales bacterium]